MRSMLIVVCLISLRCATVSPPPTEVAGAFPFEGGSRQGLRIWAEQAIEGGQDDELLIYGSGVTVWNNRAAFRLSDEELAQILRAFRDLSFEDIPQTSPRGKRLRRRAGIRTTSYSREASQTWEAPENEPLKQLVDRIFAVVGPLSRRTVWSADSLSDGLSKVARGQLPPEVLSLVFHFKPSNGDGYLFRVEHGAASSRRYVQEKLGDPVEIELSDSAIRDLAARLAAFEPQTLPVNLYARDYTEVVVRVLNQNRSVLARQFADLSPTRHGEAQTRLDGLVSWVQSVHAKWF
jgi:hypothetical protein